MSTRSVPIPVDQFVEHIYPYMGQYVAIDKRIASATTEYQEIELVWNRRLGNILVIDGIIQHTDIDEYIYSELLAHIPLTTISSLRPKVLIVGGGDLGVMKEVLKYANVERCDLVDIDGKVIELAKQHMRHIHKDCWRDSRVTITIGDGLDFVRNSECTYDAILVDGTDPNYPERQNSLFTDKFFDLAREHLAPGGMFVAQNDIAFTHPQAIAPIQRRLRRLYGKAGAYHGTVPTFQGGVQLFAYGFNNQTGPSPLPERLPAGLRYLNKETLGACFALPEYIRRLVDLEDTPDYQWRGDE